MKYFMDSEFLEGTQKKRIFGFCYGETKPTIDLISIGIVAEDGREYYAISKDFNLKEAWNRYDVKKDFGKPQGLGDKKVYWIRENVLKPIFDELVHQKLTIFDDWSFTYENIKKLINKYGKSNRLIAEEIKGFCDCGSIISNNGNNFYLYKEWDESVQDWWDVEVKEGNQPIRYKNDNQFYAYYAGYDWVAFCWLFGKMINLPQGFPMYCIDLKQELDNKIRVNIKNTNYSFSQYLKDIKNSRNYPKQINEHDALSDARWNKKLHEFINNSL